MPAKITVLALLLTACSSPDDTAEETQTSTTGSSTAEDISFVPGQLEFGDQDLFSSQTLQIQLHNTGPEELFIVDAYSSNESIEVGTPSALVLSNNNPVFINVTWTPSSVGEVAADISFDLSSPGGDTWTSAASVTGSGHGPMVVLSPREYDFGEIKVGCDAGISVSVSNAGDEDIVVEELIVDGTAAIDMKPGDNDDLPWTLTPYSTRQVNVYFTPDKVGDDAAVLEFSSGSETWSAALKGVGAVDGEETVSYTVGELAKAAAFIHVADCAIYAYDQSTLDAAVPTLFETLNDAGASYRIAFLRTSDGEMQGSYDYIDETFSVSQATEAAIEMYQGGCTMNNDATFTTVFNAVEVADDWLNEDELWEESKISLIGINNDNDTSSGNATSNVAHAQGLRDDSDMVKFHAIGENLTGACQGSVPFTGMIEAVEMTEGVFLNICDTDWDGHMEKLAAVIMNGSTSIFALGGTPLNGSIEVSLDGVNISEGWTYDEGLNAIVFYEDSYPDPGATIDISYLTSNGC